MQMTAREGLPTQWYILRTLLLRCKVVVSAGICPFEAIVCLVVDELPPRDRQERRGGGDRQDAAGALQIPRAGPQRDARQPQGGRTGAAWLPPKDPRDPQGSLRSSHGATTVTLQL